jgi:AmiR/NasT family two-component response regulator
LAILDQANRIAKATNSEKTAVIVWNGKAKSMDDATEHFRKEALKRNYKIKEISTLT